MWGKERKRGRERVKKKEQIEGGETERKDSGEERRERRMGRQI